MSSLRFPFPFPHHRTGPPNPSRRLFAAAAAVGISAGVCVAAALRSEDRTVQIASSSPWACVSLCDAASGAAVEPTTGAEFPAQIDGGRRLLGMGVRRKSVFGLKNIDVYAFGVYADESDAKRLNDKYGTLTSSELRENKDFIKDVLDQDLRMTVRLQIVYGRLNIRSVRSAFEESVGNRLRKFSGSDNKELLQRFTSLFKDEYKLPKGSLIDLSREQGFSLQIKIDGNEVGSVQNKLLCQSIFDLYIGEDPFDKKAKEDVELGLASLLKQ